ncbi:MAG: hypothetical protein HPY69_16050 [Armatimonadetes bacterium]|nr:hypothetical protein [Armatimonadota bacterium]
MADVDPAHVMGRFLRLWRAEWAGLSREQLARIISTDLGRRRRITPAIVRAWELGQPPSSTEQLMAVLATMARYGVPADTVMGFRETVLLAAVTRQYPGVLQYDSPLDRPDADAMAQGLLQESRRRGGRASLPLVLGLVEDLQGALAPSKGPRPNRAERQRLQVALAFARAALGMGYPRGDTRREEWVARQLEANAMFIQEHFGPGGWEALCPLWTRRCWLPSGAPMAAARPPGRDGCWTCQTKPWQEAN